MLEDNPLVYDSFATVGRGLPCSSMGDFPWSQKATGRNRVRSGGDGGIESGSALSAKHWPGYYVHAASRVAGVGHAQAGGLSKHQCQCKEHE